MNLSNKVPVVLLSGFLGSGKTTLLKRLLQDALDRGMRPAVMMNEVGDVNLDSELLDDSIPTSELLSGCICCTIKGDVALELKKLVEDSQPDLVFVEATGVANPLELLEAVTDAALLVRIEVTAVVTVVDAVHYLHWESKGAGKTRRLMRDQVRAASVVLLNKADRGSPDELAEAEALVRELNPKAQVHGTVRCELDGLLDRLLIRGFGHSEDDHIHEEHHNDHAHCGGDGHQHAHSQCGHEHQHEHAHCGHEHQHEHVHSYDHVMVVTHYLSHAVSRAAVEKLLRSLPDEVYRAKGIFTDAESGERCLFQYAYREVELLPIRPQSLVQDVAVFIGEHIQKQELEARMIQGLA